jgi:hypothetical protein
MSKELIDINFIKRLHRTQEIWMQFGAVESDAGYEARKRFCALSDALLKYRREFLIYRIFELLRLR